MNDDGWEARMAEKAAARSLIRAAEEITVQAAQQRQTVDEYIDAYPMTVEQAHSAAASPAYGCACAGPPAAIAYIDGAPCWCAVIAEKIRRLLTSESAAPVCVDRFHDASSRVDATNKARQPCPTCGGTWVDYGRTDAR